MNKLDLASRLAKESHRSRGKAADDVDTLIYQLLKDFRRSPAMGMQAPECVKPLPTAPIKPKGKQ